MLELSVYNDFMLPNKSTKLDVHAAAGSMYMRPFDTILTRVTNTLTFQTSGRPHLSVLGKHRIHVRVVL